MGTARAHCTRLEPTASDGGLERRQRPRHTPGERSGKRHPTAPFSVNFRVAVVRLTSGGTTAAGDGGDVSVSDFGPRRMVALDLPLGARPACTTTSFPTERCGRCCTTTRTGLTYEASRTPPTGGSTDGSPTSLSPHLRPHDTLWVHDFHLFPLAAALRELGWPGKIGFFLHVPFPSVDTFSILPWARELLEDLLVYDLVGLQTRSHARNLMHTLIEEFSRRPDRRRVRLRFEAVPRRRLPGRHRPGHIQTTRSGSAPD